MPRLTVPFIGLALLAGGLGVSAWSHLQAEQAAETSPPPQAAPTPPAQAPGEAAAAAQKLLETARETLISLKSLKARLVETVMIGDRTFKAQGSYLQGSDLKLRMELALRLPGLEGSLLEVCDGQVLWSYRQIGEAARITRRDVREIMKVASESANVPQNILTAELGLGGLPALLASIERTMTFDTVGTQHIDGEPLQVIEGTWNADFQKRFAELPEIKGELPGHIPDRVRVYFDQSHLPRRIVYLKTQADSQESRPLVRIDFEDIVVNPPVRDTDFRYEPPDSIPKEDITHQYIERLRAPAAP